jgi:hypothetical protein
MNGANISNLWNNSVIDVKIPYRHTDPPSSGGDHYGIEVVIA